MTKKKHSLLAIVSCLLLLAMAIGFTSLYLTDNDTATNTVTVGDVKIDLLEPNWEDTNNVVPNQELPKDPQIKNVGINDAVVFMTVEVPVENITPVADDGTKGTKGNSELFWFKDAADGASVHANNFDSNWVHLETRDIGATLTGSTRTYVFAYKTPISKDETTTALFDKIQVKNFIENEIAAGKTEQIKINAYGIQASDVLESGVDLTDTLSNANLDKIYGIYLKSNGNRGLYYYSSLSLAASDLNLQTTENADVADYEDAVCGLTIGENASTIEVFKNINNQESVTLSENAVLDLKHHTVDFAEGAQLLSEKDLAIYSGNIEGENSKIIKSEGNTILNNVEVSVDYTSEMSGITLNLKKGASISNSKLNVSIDNNADIYALQVTDGDCLLKNSEITAETAPNGISPLIMGCYFENCNTLIINNSKINVGETSGGVVTQARGCYINKCSNTTIDGTIIDERCSTLNGTDLRGNGLQIAGNSLNNITIGRNAPNTIYGSNSSIQVGGNVNMNVYDSYFAAPNHGAYMGSKGKGSINFENCTFECLPSTSDRYVEGAGREGAFYVASSFNGNINLDNVQLIGGTHGLRIKNYNDAGTANVSIDNSDVYGDIVAFSIDLGTLTIGKNTITHGPYSYAEIQNNGGTVIDNRD